LSGWHRTSRHARGYGSAWDRLRAQVLKRDSHLCQPCLRNGRVYPATQVDHIKPKAKGGTDDLANLEAICPPCHEAKTAAENGRTVKPKTRFTPNGVPVWD
jgi:5-methylcytosine-specific restriction protein A